MQPVLYPAKCTPVQAMSSQFLQENAVGNGYSWPSGLQVHIVGSCPSFHPPVSPSPFLQGCSQSLHPPACIDTGVAPTQVQDPALGLVEPHEVHTGPLLELVQVPLDGIPSLRCVNCATELGVICKLAEGALNPTVYVIDENKQMHLHAILLFFPSLTVVWISQQPRSNLPKVK
ncbi:hypothetical protein QYF61_020714 [Mycteria americana]|uniref:Yippee domain-containing protein n=1 Tax=Mycteria americana TaxID=33587 RepID=A0AAN7P9I5_MYCAM|nr:hypothetical protein QYF61_020714 [Mycteria americana]